MKRLFAISASVAIGLAPAIGVACEYHDAATSASVTSPALASSSPAPEATKVPAPVEAKALPKKAAKPGAETLKAKVPDDKVASLVRN